MVGLLSFWFSALGDFGTVEVTPSFVFNAAEFLNNTIVNTLKDLLFEHGTQGSHSHHHSHDPAVLEDGVQGFHHLETLFFHFLSLLCELQSMIEFDVLSSVIGAISAATMQEETHPSGSALPFLDSIASESDTTPFFKKTGAFSEHTLVSMLGEKMSTNIIRDPRNLGIIFDPKRRRFIKREGDARPGKHTSLVLD